MPDLSSVFARALQEYLETLAQEGTMPARRKRDLLLSYAELRYKIEGGSHCAICNAPVRHLVPVVAERVEGEKMRYPCLCTRCLEAEKAVSRRVVLSIGEASIEYSASGRQYKVDAAPHPDLKPMKKVRRAAAG